MTLSISTETTSTIHDPRLPLAEVLNRISDGFFAVDQDWQITFVNRILITKLSRTSNELVGRILWSVYPELRGTRYEDLFLKAMREEATVRFESFSVSFNQWFELTAYPSTSGLSVFIRDISERKAAEDELRTLSLVAKETENAVIMLDTTSKITWVNAAFTRMTGYQFEEAIGKVPSSLLIGEREPPEALHFINDQLDKCEPFQTEILNYKKNGEPFWCEVSIQPLFDEAGQLQQFFSIRKDITERKRMETELADVQNKITAAAIDAQERERAEIGRELHDNVNQVLTTVKLYTELCAAGGVDCSSILPKCTDLLNTTINEIRRISKQLAPPAISEVGLCEALLDLVQSINDTNKVLLDFDIAPLACTTISEALQVATYRIAQEHLTNILKHASAKHVSVQLACSKEQLTLSIKDDGIGFDTDKRSRGIGITNMKSRAVMHGGTLNINSTVGEGCTLQLVFPVSCCEGQCGPYNECIA